ncbi:MAG: thioesterase family protein [Propionibacteriaceae bacterium]|nr:thioesterase family protein [Propionibacteriaceae bacterium]
MKQSLIPGLTASVEVVVDDSLTVPHVSDKYPGFAEMPSVFATGYMVAFAECAAMAVIAEHLEEGESSVGVHVDIAHTAATAVGMTVIATAELLEVDGRFLTFRVDLVDDAGPIGGGSHKRAVILRDKFDASVAKRAAG